MAPGMWCFAHFDFQMCFSPQRRALFHLSARTATSAPAALASLLFEHQEPRFIEKTQRFATSLTFFAHVELLASDSTRMLIFLLVTWLMLIFLLVTWLLCDSAFQLYILSEVRLLNFLRTYTWSYMVFHVWWKCEDFKVAIRPDSSTKTEEHPWCAPSQRWAIHQVGCPSELPLVDLPFSNAWAPWQLMQSFNVIHAFRHTQKCSSTWNEKCTICYLCYHVNVRLHRFIHIYSSYHIILCHINTY